MDYSQSNMRRMRKSTSDSNVCLVLGPERTQRIIRSMFRISFHPDWKIDHGVFNRQVMVRTQILAHR